MYCGYHAIDRLEFRWLGLNLGVFYRREIMSDKVVGKTIRSSVRTGGTLSLSLISGGCSGWQYCSSKLHSYKDS